MEFSRSVKLRIVFKGLPWKDQKKDGLGAVTPYKFMVYRPLRPPTSVIELSVKLSPSVVLNITAGDGPNMYGVDKAIANIIAIKTVAIIALFIWCLIING